MTWPKPETGSLMRFTHQLPTVRRRFLWTRSNQWICRKFDGVWYVWRPNEQFPITSFPNFPVMWKPDCNRFLRGYCHCQLECPY